MDLAKDGLIILIRSLTRGDYFNIVSFGSEYRLMFEGGSRPVNPENIEESINKIRQFTADLGGTEILSCVQHVLQNRNSELSQKLFIMTDGLITNQVDLENFINDNN